MKNSRGFTQPNCVFSFLRFGSGVTLVSAAAAMAFVATKTPLPGTPNSHVKASRDARFARSGAVARHFQTLLDIGEGGESGAKGGAAQEAYANRAYPARGIDAATARTAANAADTIHQVAAVKAANTARNAAGTAQASWQQVDPNGVPADAFVASESTGASAGTIYSGRATAIAISPNCAANDCKISSGLRAAASGKRTTPWGHNSTGIRPTMAFHRTRLDPSLLTPPICQARLSTQAQANQTARVILRQA